MLLEKSAAMEHKGNDGSTPLSLAAYNVHSEVVKWLLEKGADFQHKDDDG
jgi:ankyrin repeat protein